jgi:hypothetical protein
MQQMKNFLKNRTLLTVLAVVMVWGSLTFALAPKANACPTNEIDITYYTDGTYTVECGYKIIPCSCGQTYSSGCRTAFYTTDYYPCF